VNRADALRVLIADGHADAADSLALLLGLWGHDAVVARTGAETLHAARAHRPRVVLLEPALDGLDGYAVAGRLRQEHGKAIVIVALTALADAAHRRRARENGFDLFLVKPVEPARLERLLGRLGKIPLAG
jgi:DNA-binding response OmpR family regulator